MTGVRLKSAAVGRCVRVELLGDDDPDGGCGIEIVDRDLVIGRPCVTDICRFMPTHVRGEGGMVVAVPVGHRARVAGQSKYGIVDRLLVGVVDLVGVIWLMRRRADPG